MSSATRARRMARNHRRLRQQPRLNLVALMDIFTILVLFLMVNNGDVEVLQADRHIALPESQSELRPEAALTIKVSDTDIVVQGRRITGIDDALAGEEDSIALLAEELRYQADRNPLIEDDPAGRPIIIMGDQDMPYQLLKRIMTTCAGTDYRDISLAVNSTAGDTGGSPMLASAGDSP